MTEPLYQSDYWWGVLMREENKANGKMEYLCCRDARPVVFHTRKETHAYIRQAFGYLKRQPNLRREPYGWRMPQPIKVRMTVERRP